MRPACAAVSVTLLLAGCGGGNDDDRSVVQGDTLTVYSSGPRHGTSAPAGDAVFAGQRQALREAGARAGGRRIRLVRLAATRPGDVRWDPGTVKANAERARKDPSAIAYLGELDLGASAVSLPVTNRAGLLQVSPTDGLTSLTRSPPGRPRAGPERYYPEGRRTFARLVPSDLVVMERLAALLRGRGRVAVLAGAAFADREMASILVNRLRRAGGEPALVETVPDDLDGVAGVVNEVVVSRARAVALVGGSRPGTGVVLAALARRRPGIPVLGTAGLLGSTSGSAARPRSVRAVTQVLPAGAQPMAARWKLASLTREQGAPRRAESLYGYEAMRLVLRAIDVAGPDRRGVVREGLAIRRRRTLLGPVVLDRAGDVRTRRLALMRLRAAGATIERVLP